ncbi:MAG: hypothetical protein HOV80_13635 [Polyangiaceae bacterium]|nr:hypothetical protein [Polyangiaceae bacterium]
MSYPRLLGVLVLTGCLGPVPQAADDGSTSSTETGGGGAPATTATTTTGSSPTTSSTGSMSNAGGGGSSPGELTLGGELHFLQDASVTLESGGDTVELDSNGAFTFPGKLSAGEAYDVTVSSSPPGQTCWVQNGTGTAQADVSNIDVRCTTILQSQTPSGATVETTTSTALVPIPGLDPLVFSNDIDADMVATLLVPQLTNNVVFRVALKLDNEIIGEANSQTIWNPIPAVSVPIRAVPAGNHTLTAVWSTSAGTLTMASNKYRSELSLAVLQSLPSFDRVYTTSLASNAGSTNIANTQGSPVSMGFAPLSFNVPTEPQPALISLMANDMKGDRFISRVSIDNVGFAGSVMAYDINGSLFRSQAPLGLTTLSPGDHTVTADWFRFVPANVPATRGTSGLSSTLSAILFKLGTQTDVGVLDGNFDFNLGPSYSLVHSSLQTSLDLPKPSKVLVSFHASNLRVVDQWPASADVDIFVNGVRGPTTHPYNDSDIDWGSQAGSIASIVDAPAGPVTIDVRARQADDSTGPNILQLGNMTITDATRSILSAVVLD